MCTTCGCAPADAGVTIHKPKGAAHEHHSHVHYHTHEHPAEEQGDSRTIRVEQDVLAKNKGLAARNRDCFAAGKILALNLVSSPGSGKTTILEHTIAGLKPEIPISVIEGDQQTLRDAERIDAAGVPVVQVNTGAGCHLDADMIRRALHQLSLEECSLLFLENVGNLVCPALFDLGEDFKVVIISVTEGDDKPQKYPAMFNAADICLINKIDLLPYVDFDVGRCRQFALEVNPDLRFFEVSATTGDGMDLWFDWLRLQRAEKISSPPA